MRIPLATDILRVPIADIPQLSKGFVKCCKACRFQTLQDICDKGAVEVSKSRYLGPFHFRELVDFLHKRNLLLALKD